MEYSNDILVSVVIPCYNHEEYIAETIESVLNQTYKNLEVLVGDDCSQDGTRSVIQQIKDPRLKCYFYEVNKGTVLSLNYLLKQAKGDYICMLGSDDAFAPDKLEKQLKAYQNNPSLGAVFTGVDTVDENNVLYDKDSPIALIFKEANKSQAEWLRYFFETGNHLCHSSVMIPRTVLDKIGYFDCAFRQLHDFDYWLRLLLYYPIEILPQNLTIYRRERETKNSVSAALSSNEMRVMNEYVLLFSQLFEKMPKDLFEETFSDMLNSQLPLDEASFRIERFRVMQKLELDKEEIHGAAVRFFLNNIAPLIETECCEAIPDGVLREFYELTGKPIIGEQLIEVQKRERETTEKLRNELEMIYSSRSWKIVETIRKVKSLAIKK